MQNEQKQAELVALAAAALAQANKAETRGRTEEQEFYTGLHIGYQAGVETVANANGSRLTARSGLISLATRGGRITPKQERDRGLSAALTGLTTQRAL